MSETCRVLINQVKQAASRWLFTYTKVTDLCENMQFDYCCMFIDNVFMYLILSYIVSNDGPENVQLRVKDVEGKLP